MNKIQDVLDRLKQNLQVYDTEFTKKMTTRQKQNESHKILAHLIDGFNELKTIIKLTGEIKND